MALRPNNNPPNGKVKSKIKSMLIIFCDIKDIVRKAFALVGQSIPHTTVIFCGDCVKILRRLRPEFWRLKYCLLHCDNALSHTSFFTRESFTKNNVTVVLHPPYFSLFPD
jgi:hypothetical protein